jgi:nitroreductase
VIKKIATECVKGFTYNIGTLEAAKGVAILSYVKGKSGKLDKYGIEGENPEKWEVFDSGIACQTFCLAAHAKGIGTCVFGVIDEDKIAQVINLPEGETVSALIVFGHENGTTKAPRRKETSEIMRWL